MVDLSAADMQAETMRLPSLLRRLRQLSSGTLADRVAVTQATAVTMLLPQVDAESQTLRLPLLLSKGGGDRSAAATALDGEWRRWWRPTGRW